jgi:hypothetical protein
MAKGRSVRRRSSHVDKDKDLQARCTLTSVIKSTTYKKTVRALLMREASFVQHRYGQRSERLGERVLGS